MKNLRLISFVGVDKHSNLNDILDFEVKTTVPMEFSVLFSDTKSKQKDNRYPDYDFCLDFLKNHNVEYFNSLRSLHLCGDVIDRYFNQEQDIMDLCQNAWRIQLNLNIRKYSDIKKLSHDILRMSDQYDHTIILQENVSKKSLIKEIISNNTNGNALINILYDGSGGFGREISYIYPPYTEYLTGYAGGIKPENVVSIINKIEKVNSESYGYYIDMESGVRENNIFSLDKCRQVIDNIMLSNTTKL